MLRLVALATTALLLASTPGCFTFCLAYGVGSGPGPEAIVATGLAVVASDGQYVATIRWPDGGEERSTWRPADPPARDGPWLGFVEPRPRVILSDRPRVVVSPDRWRATVLHEDQTWELSLVRWPEPGTSAWRVALVVLLCPASAALDVVTLPLQLVVFSVRPPSI